MRPFLKAYCQLQTNKGNINVEIHCDIVPRMAENFLGLCEKEYYDGTKFHRSIRNFMLQARYSTAALVKASIVKVLYIH